MPILRVVEPDPLKEGCFVQTRRGVSVVFDEFRGPVPVISKIEPAEDCGLPVDPGVSHVVPKGFGNAEELEEALVPCGPLSEIQAHGMEFTAGFLDIPLDLLEGKGKAGALVPGRNLAHTCG